MRIGCIKMAQGQLLEPSPIILTILLFLFTEIASFEETLQFLLSSLPVKVKNRRNNIGQTEIHALCIIAENFLTIDEILENNLAKITKENLRKMISSKVERLLVAFRNKSKCIRQNEIDFFYSEVKRLERYVHFYSVQCSELYPAAFDINRNIYDLIVLRLRAYPYTTENDENVKQDLNKFLKVNFISAKEKEDIRRAMGSDLGYGQQQGHWYTCSCGYIYSVANCGRFNQSSQCPQCHAVIGGGSTNTHAQPSYWNRDTRAIG